MNTDSVNRIKVLLHKEWLEFWSSRVLVMTTFATPTFLLACVLPMLLGMGDATGESDAEAMAELIAFMGERGELFTHSDDVLAVYLGEMGLMMLLLLPCVIPSFIAATSIVREKESKCLESLLTTPLHTWELVVSKQLFCLLVGILPSALGVVVYYALLYRTVSEFAFGFLASPGWLITLTMIAPMLALLSTSFAVAVSSRAKDIQSAQQFSGLLILPLFGVMAFVGAGVASISTLSALSVCGILAPIIVLSVAFAISLFERETVLTRWY